MFDIPPAIETYCGTEVAELVQYVDPRTTDNTSQMEDIISKTYGKSCENAIIDYFFSLIDGQQSNEFMAAIIGLPEVNILDKQIPSSTINLIKNKIKLINYQNNARFSNRYFRLLTFLNYPMTDEIKYLNVGDDEDQLWYKNTYLAHNGDSEAIAYIKSYLKTIEYAPELSSSLSSLQFIKKSVRDQIFVEFIDDGKLLYRTDGSTTTIGSRAQSLMENNY